MINFDKENCLIEKKSKFFGYLLYCNDEKQIKNKFVNFSEDAIYVKPNIFVRVHYLERTSRGALRHATIDE